MRNLAGDETCDAAILDELKLAKINAHHLPLKAESEVPTQLVGIKLGWTFRRAWYYWIATGPGISADRAEAFYVKQRDARVDGHCGAPSPLEWRGGFAIDTYHIDTQDALNDFAQLLREIVRENIAALGARSPWIRRQIAETMWLVADNEGGQ